MNFIADSEDKLKKIPLQLSSDEYGKLYFTLTILKDDPYFSLQNKEDKIVYQLNINKDNKPFLEKGSLDIIQKTKKNIGKLQILGDNSLKKRLKKEKKKEKRRQQNDSDEDDGEGYDMDHPLIL